MRRVGWTLSLLAIAAGTASAQEFDHGAWNALVENHVTDAGVRYAALKADPAGLDAYIAQIARVDSSTFDAWPRDAQVAYLINAYNALVVSQVIGAYPLRRNYLSLRGWGKPARSVWQIRGFFDSIRHRVAGRDLTLDDIEHVWLRARLDEPRIHFALVCAAASCPPFRSEAFVAGRLDEQLDDQASRFFHDAARNRFDRSAGVVHLSSILDWFGGDFERFAEGSGFSGTSAQKGSLAFAARFVPPATAEWLRTGGYEIRYIEYDWTLNDASAPVAHR